MMNNINVLHHKKLLKFIPSKQTISPVRGQKPKKIAFS